MTQYAIVVDFTSEGGSMEVFGPYRSFASAEAAEQKITAFLEADEDDYVNSISVSMRPLRRESTIGRA